MSCSTKSVSSVPCMRVARWRRGLFESLFWIWWFTGFRLLELEADEDAPRHVSINNDDKNIPLSVAEAQVRTDLKARFKIRLIRHWHVTALARTRSQSSRQRTRCRGQKWRRSWRPSPRALVAAPTHRQALHVSLKKNISFITLYTPLYFTHFAQTHTYYIFFTCLTLN